MAIHLLLIGGGTAIASTISYFRGQNKNHQENLPEEADKPQSIVEVHHQDMLERKEEVDNDLKLSGLAMGVTGMAQLAYPPLLIVGVPLAIYSSLPIFVDAWKGIYEKQKLRSTVIDSIAIGGALVTQFYFTTSLVNVAYFIGQKILVQTEDTSNQQLLQLFNTHPRNVWLWLDNTEIEVPFEDRAIGFKLSQ